MYIITDGIKYIVTPVISRDITLIRNISRLLVQSWALVVWSVRLTRATKGSGARQHPHTGLSTEVWFELSFWTQRLSDNLRTCKRFDCSSSVVVSNNKNVLQTSVGYPVQHNSWFVSAKWWAERHCESSQHGSHRYIRVLPCTSKPEYALLKRIARDHVGVHVHADRQLTTARLLVHVCSKKRLLIDFIATPMISHDIILIRNEW